LILSKNTGAKNIGEEVYALGYPADADTVYGTIGTTANDVTVTGGIVSAYKEINLGYTDETTWTMQIDVAIAQGNSGGPLVNENGEVIGVLVAGVQNAEGMNYAIPVDMAKEFLAHVITSMKLPQQALGELSEQTFTSLSVKEKISACIEIVIDTLSVILKVLAII